MISEADLVFAILQRAGPIAFHGCQIPSRTLQAALHLVVDPTEARLELPHYWAVYYHDGFGPVEAAPGKFLCWFPDITNDPRFQRQGGYAVNLTDVEHLTKDEFKNAVAENTRRRLAGQPPFMIVARFSKAKQAKPFFSDLDAVIEVDVTLAVDDEITKALRDFSNETSGTVTVTLNI